MEYINRIEIRGTVGFCRQQTLDNGRKVVHLSVATSYVYKGRNNEAVIETTWHNVTAWESRQIPDVEQIKKGDKVQLSGRIRTQKYTDTDGVERISYEIVATQLKLIEGNEQLAFEML